MSRAFERECFSAYVVHLSSSLALPQVISQGKSHYLETFLPPSTCSNAKRKKNRRRFPIKQKKPCYLLLSTQLREIFLSLRGRRKNAEAYYYNSHTLLLLKQAAVVTGGGLWMYKKYLVHPSQPTFCSSSSLFPSLHLVHQQVNLRKEFFAKKGDGGKKKTHYSFLFIKSNPFFRSNNCSGLWTQ